MASIGIWPSLLYECLGVCLFVHLHLTSCYYISEMGNRCEAFVRHPDVMIV